MKKMSLRLGMIALLSFGAAHAQTLAVYWGLEWSLSPTAVDSVLLPVSKVKKIATQTNYADSGEQSVYSGHSYLIEDKGISKIYVWYNSIGEEKVSIHSVEVIYQFDYPYDAQRFKAAYLEKYGKEFQSEPEIFQVTGGATVLLRTVKEPAPDKLGTSIYRVSLFSPIPFEATDDEVEFLY
ncbi:MAG: hypothetical protein K9M49_03300 [Candidatus Marinimicrobia bacterium]|nr:hypothetical protein [Candidatus Neomarinimicrobiota bacterium]MCF7850887.1 hypothetical protein [Candidatus Neomarinimicrobiota bacterium]MCF7904160.1 hypothetical protein [Candidatus Neomarinimicrobiota bacterium]